MLTEIELTQLFIDYAETKKRSGELEEKIKEEILGRGKSAEIAGVKASYYKPSFETPDYENFALSNMPSDFDISPYSTTYEPSVKWKEVCEALQLEAPKGSPKPARVTVK